MRIPLITALLLLAFVPAQAENFTVTGILHNSRNTAIAGASVSLLYTSDSTLAAFGVSNTDGAFQVKHVAAGTYILQVAAMGYYTFYRPLSVPGDIKDGLGVLQLEDNEQGTLLKGVVISGDKVPVRIKGDTIEYNAGSYRLQPNAVTEDLLRQLPGMQVDQNGNIKAMGKNVNKVLVDGKEFFGTDPKVATKNLPADAIDKVQTYNKHSDRSEFTGIDDGQRNQTINLVLKEGKKAGYFGDVRGGAGTDDHYDAAGKLFRFREKTQLAAMGMLNDINKFGFSLNDYMNFSGGLGAMGSGRSSFSFNSDDNMPLDFGQPQSGDISSGAVGLNFTKSPRKNNRFNTSYMGSGVQTYLQEQIYSRNFLPGQVYRNMDTATTNSSNMRHALNASWRNDIDSFRQLTMSLNLQVSEHRSDRSSSEYAILDSMLQNKQQSSTAMTGSNRSANGSFGFVQKLKGKWQLFQTGADFSYEHKINGNDLLNRTQFFAPASELLVQQYQDQVNTLIKAGISPSMVRSLGQHYYFVPSLTYNFKQDILDRNQGITGVTDGRIDSLSPLLRNTVHIAGAGLSIKRSLPKVQWNATLEGQQVSMTPEVNGHSGDAREFRYLLPSFFWRRDIGSGKNLSFSYRSNIETPLAYMLLPVTDYSNPLYRVSGNPSLRPEYSHQLHLDYSRFDQFTMSSLFIYVDGTYTRDKINYARYVRPDLSQDLQWANTAYENRGVFSINYSRPIKALDIDANMTLTEEAASSLSPVNGVDNRNTTFKHMLELALSNRKNKVWNIRAGGNIRISDSRYSLNRELNNVYNEYTGFLHISWRPAKSWLLLLHADISHYTASSFNQAVDIPLLRAELSHFILPAQRGTITLSGFDLLDKNVSLIRTSQMNFLLQRSANTIRQYFLLTFTYKLSKMGSPMPMMINN